MVNTQKVKSLLERELENEEFRHAFEEGAEAFQLEAQILYALEQKKWTYNDLAKATRTSKGNVSRDLASGGILNASFSRIGRIADALGMKLVGLLIPKETASFVLPKIEELIRESANAAYGKTKIFAIYVPTAKFVPYSREQNTVANSKERHFIASFPNSPIIVGV